MLDQDFFNTDKEREKKVTIKGAIKILVTTSTYP